MSVYGKNDGTRPESSPATGMTAEAVPEGEQPDMEQLRRRIDEIDGQLVELLKARMAVSGQVAQYKKRSAGAVVAPDRERALLNKVGERSGPELRAPVQEIYQSILSASRALQKKHGCGRFGLVGERLEGSALPDLHKKLGGYPYQLFELGPDELGPFLQNNAFDGVNIEGSYEEMAVPFCDELTPAARCIGSVNTIVRCPDGTLLGHHTGCDAFRLLLRSAGIEVRGKKALVLGQGQGGASHAAQAVLYELGAGEVAAVRPGEDLSRYHDAVLLVDTDPAEDRSHRDLPPVDLEQFLKLERVFDLNGGPAVTPLMEAAAQRNIPCTGGFDMVAAQARAAAELFLERPLPDGLAETVTASMK